MDRKTYWMMVSLVVLGISLVFFILISAMGPLLNAEFDHVLAYFFLMVGVSVFYFGLLRPDWFTKEIIPAKSKVKMKVTKNKSTAFSLRDDAYFWNLFPYALFFTFGGIAYLQHPNPYTLVVALVCSLWVKLLYKLI